ncbi:BT2A1 protein, partial [Atractosteus spatula]|nr:BT2A1 protein [Atractosteus spatula]
MCFTETWLQELIPDSNVTIGGFQTVRADRNTESGKRKGGGLAVLVNNRWCNPGHTHVKERVCNPDIELVAVGLRPYYLPREFTCAIFVVVYIPPTANAEVACDVINTVTARLQTKHPSAFIAISGDFNHVSISTTLPTFHQFVKCPTRENKTLDLLYANAKDAYSSTALPPLGRSDHNLVLLTPLYTPIVQRQPVTMRTVRRWSQEAMEDLRGALEATDWDVLCEPHGDDIDSMVDCVTDYINFCVDNTIPTKDVHCFSNNKPWITSDLKALLNDKKRAFRRGDKEEVKRVQRELKQKLRESKDAYRKKIEDKLQRNRVRDVWSSMREITGFKQAGGATEGNLEMANELNQFFNSCHSPTNELKKQAKQLKTDLRITGGVEAQIAKAENDVEDMVAKVRESVANKYLELRKLIDNNEQKAFQLIAAEHKSIRLQLERWKMDCNAYQNNATETVESAEQKSQLAENSNDCSIVTDLMVRLLQQIVFYNYIILFFSAGHQLTSCFSFFSLKSLEFFIQRLKKEMRFDHRRLAVLEESVEHIVRKNMELLPRPWEYAVDLTFDENTAHKNLRVSEDKKQVSNVSSPQKTRNTDEWFDIRPYVLATNTFSSGQHYWEVEVQGMANWCVGVVYNHRTCKGSKAALGLDKNSWGLQMLDGDFLAMHNGESVLLEKWNVCDRVGIFLDYNNGYLTFYCINKAQPMHTFRAKFKKPLRPAFGINCESSLLLCNLVPEEDPAGSDLGFEESMPELEGTNDSSSYSMAGSQ